LFAPIAADVRLTTLLASCAETLAAHSSAAKVKALAIMVPSPDLMRDFPQSQYAQARFPGLPLQWLQPSADR
jgi:hypothetical protein